jgi:hypothetical protein
MPAVRNAAAKAIPERNQMRNRESLKVLALCVVGMAAVGPAAYAEEAEPLYVPPLSDNLNVRFVENHIVIDRPAEKVFAWVTTPKNMSHWFPQMLGWDVYKGRTADQPQKIGDSVTETVIPATPGGPPRKHRYTVVALVPGVQWTAVSQTLLPNGEPSPEIHSIANFTVRPLPGGKSLFIRLYESVRTDPRADGPDTSDLVAVPRKGTVQDPEIVQAGLVHLKDLIEKDLPKE